MITKKAKFLHVLNNVYFKKTEPVSIVHFITNRCNARCSFCFIDFDNPNTFKGELTLGEIEKLTKTLGNNRQASVSRELTKIYEETKRGSLEEIYKYFSEKKIKGEFVIVISGKK